MKTINFSELMNRIFFLKSDPGNRYAWRMILSACIILFGVLPVKAQEEQDTIMLEAVTISDQAIRELNHIAVNYIEKAELKNTNIRDVGDYLRSIPNVSGIRRGGAAVDPVVRGYKFNQLNVLLNSGVRIEGGCPNRMDPVTAHLEPEDLERIEVIKGPFSMIYGPSFGGVINLVTEYPRPYEDFEIHAEGLYGMESNWNGKRFHGKIYGGGKKLFFHAAGGYKNYGNYNSGNLEGTDTTYSSAFTKYNYNARLGYAINDNNQLFLGYEANHGRDMMFPALPMDEREGNTRIYSMDYHGRNLSPIVKGVDVKAYLTDVYHVMDNQNRPNYSFMQMVAEVDAVNTGGRAMVDLQISKHHLQAGTDYEHIWKDGKRVGVMEMMGTISTNTKNLWRNAVIRNLGVFAEYRTYFSAYELNAGIRLDYNQANSEDTLKVIHEGTPYFDELSSEFVNLSASLGLTRRLTNWLDISLAVGRGTRSPNMLERYIKLLPVGYDRFDYLGNPQLKPETNNEIDLTLQASHEGFGNFYLNFFYSYVEDFINANLVPPAVITPQSPNVVGVKQFYNADHVTSRGFEFGYKTPQNMKLGAELVAAYTHGVIPNVTQYVISEGTVVDERELRDDGLLEIPPLEATLNVYYRFLNGKLVPRLTVRSVAAQHHVSEAFYEQETPGFTILNLSARYTINQYMNIHAGINNLLDLSYYEHLNRRIIGSNMNLFEPGRVFYATVYLKI